MSVDPSMMAMPILIINMGGEMMYILEQRLQAQEIVSDKASRVLQEVISTMFSNRFVTELFKPQKMYNNDSTRQIFDKLAHSSIMRLNKSSMEKLYDLMTMGCKYQITSCADPADILQVTLNHLDALTLLIKGSPVADLVAKCKQNFLDGYSNLTRGQWYTLRLRVCSFFQDRRVKVSLFLSDNIQAQDGSIIISHDGVLPAAAEPPGMIRSYDSNGRVVAQDRAKVLNSAGVKPARRNVDPFAKNRPIKLGRNLYSADRSTSGKKSGSPVKGPMEDMEVDEEASKTATTELNVLANLMGGGGGNSVEKLNISLFGDDDEGGGGNDGGESGKSNFIVFDVDDRKSNTNKVKAELDSWDTGNANNEDDDLLAMMDSLSA